MLMLSESSEYCMVFMRWLWGSDRQRHFPQRLLCCKEPSQGTHMVSWDFMNKTPFVHSYRLYFCLPFASVSACVTESVFF